jgi:hypothetical protein
LIFSSIIGEERLTVEKWKKIRFFCRKKKNRNIKNEIKRTVCFVAMAKVDDVIDGWV